MPDYETLYFRLFAAAADAVEALERLDIGRAKELLIQAQQEAEERYLSEDE
ncbi:MAG: hypothetical protein ACI3W8_04760 [Oscillospiraceae bacterium]